MGWIIKLWLLLGAASMLGGRGKGEGGKEGVRASAMIKNRLDRLQVLKAKHGLG